jgi:hypothetical protein
VKFDVRLDAKKTDRRLERLPDGVRDELVGAARVLDAELIQYARMLASGGLVNVITGRYLRSIKGNVRATRTTVTGKVYSRAPEAHLIELGAVRKAMDILPNVAQAMSFMVAGKRVVAKRVHHPGSVMKGRHVLHIALDDMRDEIFGGMHAALNRGLARQ